MLHTVSVWFLILSAVSFLVIAADLFRHPQKMTVMDFVWPITALYFGPFALWTYFSFGREKESESSERPYWQKVWVGTTHCGAGCTLGDIIAEWAVFLAGFALLGSILYASYLFDFLAAYLLGIIFQYFSIAPMRHISGWPAIKAALKADTISLTAFEIGLFVFMAWMHSAFHPHLKPSDPSYWFLMQIGMIIGFFTSFPANWWLINKGWKEAM
ncbi:MAG: DUF4396 domain-containing protein [Acidobacteriota bacterium]|nr:DUF4396 domain-containing protein [Acidobacteriota bacterium]